MPFCGEHLFCRFMHVSKTCMKLEINVARAGDEEALRLISTSLVLGGSMSTPFTAAQDGGDACCYKAHELYRYWLLEMKYLCLRFLELLRRQNG